jgi:zinc protease
MRKVISGEWPVVSAFCITVGFGALGLAQTTAREPAKPASDRPVVRPAAPGSEATVRTVRDLPSWKDLKFKTLPQIKIPNPEQFTLPNGMKVFLLENHELPLVSGFALVRTGNLFDPPAKKGLAELTGMVLRSGGTQSKSGDEIDETLENIAASVESSIGESRGDLSFSCLRENTAQVMRVFRDFMTSAEFRQDKVDLATTQLRSSIARRNDDPSGIASREFSSLVYGPTSPYGWIIQYADVDNIQRQDLIDFYKRYYFPSNIMLAVYGDFSAADMRSRIEKLFEDWNYKQPAAPSFPAFSSKPEPGIYLAEKPDVTQTFFEIGHIGGLLRDKDFPALQVAADILGSGFTSRLVRRVRTELGYAYNIGASWGAGFLAPGLFSISGSTKSQSTSETIQTIEAELRKLRTGEVTDEELKTAKDTVLNSFVFFFDTPAKTLNRVVLYEYYGYPKDFIFTYQKAVAAVTKADVLRVSQEYLKPENLTIVAVGNASEFAKPLSTLKVPVHPIDLTIPQPKQEKPAVSSASVAQGRVLLSRMQEAMGGKSKLAAVKDFDRTAEGTAQFSGPAKVKQRERFIAPAYIREDQQLPFGTVTVYSDGKSGWMAGPQGAQPLPGPVMKQVEAEVFHNLLTLALSDADASRTVAASAPDILEIRDKGGNVTRLELNSAGLPAKQMYESMQMTGKSQPVEEVFSDWREVNGVKTPFHVVIRQSGKDFADLTVTEMKINTGITIEELSKKP